MPVMKRVTAQIGSSHRSTTKIASGEGFICPHCLRQTQFVQVGVKNVCQLCGKAPEDKPSKRR